MAIHPLKKLKQENEKLIIENTTLKTRLEAIESKIPYYQYLHVKDFGIVYFDLKNANQKRKIQIPLTQTSALGGVITVRIMSSWYSADDSGLLEKQFVISAAVNSDTFVQNEAKYTNIIGKDIKNHFAIGDAIRDGNTIEIPIAYKYTLNGRGFITMEYYSLLPTSHTILDKSTISEPYTDTTVIPAPSLN